LRPHRPGRWAVPPGPVPVLLRDLAWLAVGLGLLVPLAHGLLQRPPAAPAGVPALIARLEAAEPWGGPGEPEEKTGSVLHLLPDTAHDGACAPDAPRRVRRPVAVGVVVPCPDGCHAARGRPASP
jgi:hypothetical protein